MGKGVYLGKILDAVSDKREAQKAQVQRAGGREGRADLPYTGHGLTYERVVSEERAQRVRREETVSLEKAPAYSRLGCRKTRRGMSTI